MLAQPVVPVHLKPIVDMSVNRQREATNDLIKGFTILAEVTNPNDPTGALIAAADTILQRHVAEHKVPEEYPADWAKLRALYVTLEKTEHTRDRRRETLSLALGNPDDFQYGLLKKLSDYFGVTYYEATCARFHSLEHGAGMPTPHRFRRHESKLVQGANSHAGPIWLARVHRRKCAGGARYLRHAINVQARQPKHHQVLHLAGRCRQLAQRRPARNSS